ncbi:MAG TPA: hypothetical protein VF844_13820 [Ktedonobacteraceae bacterium]
MISNCVATTCPFKCLHAVTVSAAYFAFGDLSFDAGPSTALREQVRYLICFVTTYVVEFEDTDIRVTAIDAGMVTEVDMHHLIAFSSLLSGLGTTPTFVLFNCFNTMTVSATNFAFSYFGFDRGPAETPAKKIGYPAGFLSIDVIKLKEAYI